MKQSELTIMRKAVANAPTEALVALIDKVKPGLAKAEAILAQGRGDANQRARVEFIQQQYELATEELGRRQS